MTDPQPSLDRAVVEYLLNVKRRGVSLGLERMRAFVAALGNPQERVPVVHIAGTNGKGSVAAMVEAILRASGWRVGLYTSPHLVRLGERIQVDRQPIAGPELSALVRELRDVSEGMSAAERPSYFEFMTAAAFVHFARTRCDIAVIEVGMGGRLDATNVVNPEFSVITSIGLDHTEVLGDTIEAIAREKAGIIKPARPVVLGRLSSAAEAVVRRVAAERGGSVASVTEAFGTEITAFPDTNLRGAYQRVNAGTALLAARELGRRWRCDEAVARSALCRVEWAGRWHELRVAGRRVIIDASHNADGAVSLGENLRALAAEGAAPIVVIGVLGVTRAKPLLAAVAPWAAEIELVVPKQARACRHEELERLIPTDYRGGVRRTSVGELFPGPGTCVFDAGPEVPVVVTGSIYLAGEVLAQLEPARGPLEAELQDF